MSNFERWPEDLYGKDPEQIECWICKDTGLREDGTDCDHEEEE